MNSLRYVDPPSGLLEAIKHEPKGTELVIASGYFLRRVPNATAYEVWLTPRRCHFVVEQSELTDEARRIIDSDLPRFVDILTPDARKMTGSEPWRWRALTTDIPFVGSANDTPQPIHSFCRHGNWIIFAGIYAFHYSMPFQPPVWGPLAEVDVDLIVKLLEIGYCCNPRPYIQPSSFSQFVVSCQCSAYPRSESAKQMVLAVIREREQQDAEQKRKQKIILFKCTHCDGELRARFYMAGENVACKHCGKPVAVPNDD